VSQELTLDQFKVVMQDLADATTVVDAQQKTIELVLGDLQSTFVQAQQLWQSPAASSLGSLTQEFQSDANALCDLLGEIVSRMRQTYSNYEAAEQQAIQNLDAQKAAASGGQGG
jgi:WXG100 family type VII secretion target